MASSSDSDWERLPLNLQESILLLLPISTLLVCKSLSRSFLHTIRSPSFLSAYSLRRSRHLDDLIFLLFIDGIGARRPSAIAFLPVRASWIHLPLPHSLCHIHTSSGCLVVAEKFEGGQFVSDLLSRTVTPIAPMSFHSYILSLVEDEASTEFKIVSSSKNVIDGGILRPSDCQVYNSSSRRWESSGQFPHHYAMLGNAILLNGMLFVLGRDPDHLLAFDLKTRMWSVVDEELPLSLLCFHLLVFEERLFLVGGLDGEELTITRIEIWEYDLVEKQWGMFCFMPDEIFLQFCGNGLFNFDTIDQLGIVLFCNTREFSIIMFDMSSKIWSRAPDCEQPKSRKSWIGHALVPSVQLLK
ncbi:F-box/kelch-repeat protein At5g43190-like isoform X1 [Zingiber officinale]|uniref:F-box domain-containing protein n=1 Tax=Zingiber officinale TaxID=94328 RepID=A0A8J5KGS0_ZINOF|nr:F-box/kelch-repeat protein At5g43190-like isoform X1 [Zingiber officinale]XP_042426418.1 F-box/kelch-repeat protein At5g43190-like isoform X1 [Zingiber officinale]XP_042426419.1 F-box/kelch-repeat protein At5g43190-like isoform X1 [Zingiber officinale]KAG6482896.1 hypothetical protein ZIOFF_059535 [Zingiber officinale]